MPKRQRGNRVAQIDECRVANHQERIIAGRGLDCSIQRVRPFEFNRLYRQTQCCCLVEANFKPKMIGGAMVGLQSTAIKARLGPLLNGWTIYDVWLPVPKMLFAGVDELMKKYQAHAAVEGVDALGYYMVPWSYAQLQVLQQAVTATQSLDDARLGDYIRANTFKTVVGDVKFGSDGELAQSRVLQVQFRNVKTNDLTQFKDISTQVVVAPAEYESGRLIYPYEQAK